MDENRADIHQAPTIGPLTQLFFFVFACLAMGLVLFRVSGTFVGKTYSGRVVGHEVEVAPKTGGKILRIEVEKNSPVEKGQVVAVLSDETLEARIKSASEELHELRQILRSRNSEEQKRSELFDLKEKKVESTFDLKTVRVEMERIHREIRSASVRLSQARERMERAETLFAKQALTQSELDKYRMEVFSASGTMANLRMELIEKEEEQARLVQLVELYERRQEEIAHESSRRQTELEVEIKKKEGDLETLLIRKEALIVRTDHSGVVSRTPKAVGEIVSAGEPILYLSTGEKLWVEASLPASDSDVFEKGDRVEIVAEKIEIVRLTGTVQGTLPILRTESRSSVGAFEDRNRVATVLVEFDDLETARKRLRDGQMVTIRPLPLSASGAG